MKHLLIAVMISLFAAPAMAAPPCRNGTPGIFDFVSWSFKKEDAHWMEMTITVQSNLETALNWYEVQIETDNPPHDFGFKSKVPLPARGQSTSKVEFGGMEQEEVDFFMTTKPRLCAIGVTDDKGNHTSYY